MLSKMKVFPATVFLLTLTLISISIPTLAAPNGRMLSETEQAIKIFFKTGKIAWKIRNSVCNNSSTRNSLARKYPTAIQKICGSTR